MRRINWTHLRGAGLGRVPPIEKPSEKLARISREAARACADSGSDRGSTGDLVTRFSAWRKGRVCFR